jgi:hypothetical protein
VFTVDLATDTALLSAGACVQAWRALDRDVVSVELTDELLDELAGESA